MQIWNIQVLLVLWKVGMEEMEALYIERIKFGFAVALLHLPVYDDSVRALVCKVLVISLSSSVC